jgi:hypothetical protein
MTDAERSRLSRNKRSLAHVALQREQAEQELASTLKALIGNPAREQIEERAVMDRWHAAFSRHRKAITAFIKHAAIRPGNSNVIPMDVVHEIGAAEKELNLAQAEIDRVTQEIRTGKRR